MRNLLLVGLLIISILPAFGADTVAIVYLSADDSLPIGKELFEGDRVSTSEGVMIKLPDGSDIELEKNTQVRLSQMRTLPGKTVTRVELSRGAFRARVPTNRNCNFVVVTPVSTAGVRGTDFSVVYTPSSPTAINAAEQAEVDVYEGSVDVTQEGAAELVSEGNGATATRRGIARRKLNAARQEKWEERRSAIIERVRTRLNLGPDDSIADAIRDRLKNLSPEKREQIKSRLENQVKAHRERMQRRQRLQNRRDGTPGPAPAPVRRRR